MLLEVGGISYEILIPSTVMQRIAQNVHPGNTVTLVTYHYFQVEPSRSTPLLIGFLNEVEKEFFETFITVSGIGPRAAVKALNQPISLIARAIDDGDVGFLKTLPGIGQQRARNIVASLQQKIGKFALIRDDKVKFTSKISDIQEEAVAVLMQLEYKKTEAVNMVRSALERTPHIQTTAELLNEVYKQRKIK